ncbi:hypothetical protein PV370_30285, partial [Streptomyces sp. NE06-03C]|nr:hypothetical protein [Streptomyces sp. NE06-03C]
MPVTAPATTMKVTPDDENEVHDVLAFRDPGHCHVTPVVQFPPEIAVAVTDALRHLVQSAHR